MREGTESGTRGEGGGPGERSGPGYLGGPVEGTFSANRAGYGFIKTATGDIFVPASRVHGAMDGDLVAARIQPARRRGRPGRGGGGADGGLRFEAEVVRVLERAHPTIVGRFEKRGKARLVVPSDRRLFYPILVRREVAGGAGVGDMVVVEMIEYPDHGQAASGRVIEVLGDESLPTIEIDVIVREHGLGVEFPAAALEEAGRTAASVGRSDIGARKDYRDMFTVTIDGLDAQDFDDAISIEREAGPAGGRGGRGRGRGRGRSGERESGRGGGRGDERTRLVVHIADVDHYVGSGSALDEEALSRATSVYLVDRVLPMLPPELSNGICSLNPRVDRLTLSVEVVVDGNGEVYSFEINEGVIRSDERLTYEDVDRMFETNRFPDERVRKLLVTVRELSDVLEAKRLARGSLNFETIEPKVILDENFAPVDVIVRERTPATKLIEETMILMNEAVASFMYWQEAPMIYRIHDKPDEAAIVQMGELVQALGYPVKRVTADSRILQRIIDLAHERPEKLLINNLLLRAMKRAKYSAACTPHFGLASAQYTHFTSPIRRYPDLTVHRLVKAALGTRLHDPGIVGLAGKLNEIADHCSAQEREAEEAERESVDVKLCELMRGRIGEIFDGTITGVANYGFFVQLPNSAEGLVSTRELRDDRYHYDDRLFMLRGRHKGRTFQIGQKVRVALAGVIVGERRIDFVLAE